MCVSVIKYFPYKIKLMINYIIFLIKDITLGSMLPRDAKCELSINLNVINVRHVINAPKEEMINGKATVNWYPSFSNHP